MTITMENGLLVTATAADASPLELPSSSTERHEQAMECGEDDCTADEYARLHLLTVDYTLFGHTSYDCPLPELGEEGLFQNKNLPELFFPSSVSYTERLQIAKQHVAILNETCRRLSSSELHILGLHASFPRSILGKKLEAPALMSDLEADTRYFARQIKNLSTVNLCEHHLPQQPVFNDEGLEFPQLYSDFNTTVLASVGREKLEVAREHVVCLSQALNKLEWTSQTREAWFGEEYPAFCQSDARVTPPLTPRLSPYEPFIPDPEKLEIPILSDPSSLLSADLRIAEEPLVENAKDWLEITEQAKSPPRCRTPDILALVDRNDRVTTADLKVDVPLLLPSDDAKPSEPELSETKDWISRLLPTHESRDTEHLMELDTSFKKELHLTASKVQRSTEQEKLIAVNTTARVPVPAMDFTIPEPVWKPLLGDPKAMLCWIIEQSGHKPRPWPGIRELEKRLRWVPWPSRAAKPPAIEKLEYPHELLDSAIPPYHEDYDATVASFMRKHPGLKIFREDFDMEEQDLQLVVGRPSLLQLAKKRKRDASEQVPVADGTIDASQRPQRSILFGNEGRTAASLLDNYMVMHAPEKRPLGSSPFFAARKSAAEAKRQKRFNTDLTQAQQLVQPSEPQPGSAIALPRIEPLAGTPGIVASEALPPEILDLLQGLLPDLHIVKRDYSAYNTSVWQPGSVCRSVVISPLADEADIIISPSTGVLLTSMIRLRQKPIPGTKGRSAIRMQVEKICARYERLFILVSEGEWADVVTAPSPADVAAMAEFVGFTGGLDAHITTFAVGDGHQTKAHWIATLISRHAHTTDDIRPFLTATETYWELFLRRAGVNIFAALVILGSMRTPDHACEAFTADTTYGLAAFVKMSHEDRVAAFESMLGGRKVLDRVTKLIDACWDK